jgi:uncharacterized membrane protein YkgB
VKNLFEGEPILYWKNKIKIYMARRDSYKPKSNKWFKYNMLYKKAEYHLALWRC